MNSSTVSARAVAKVLLVILAFAFAIYFLSLIKDVLIWLFIALFLSLAMGPPVSFLSRHKVPRSLAILLVYLGLLLSIFGVGLLVVPPIVSQVNKLAKDAPGYINDVRRESEQFRKYDEKYHISKKLIDQAEELPQKLGSAAGALRDVTVTVFSRIVALVTILVMTFFLLQDGGRWWSRVLALQPPGRRERMRGIGEDIYRAVGGYVNGNLLISLIAGIITWITLELLNVPFAVPLAVTMGFLDLIPLVGATLGGVLIGIVTLFVNFPTAFLVWIVVLLAYQQLENHLIQPQIYKRSVKIHPLLVIVAILIGGTLLGVLGALVAIPVAAAVQLIVKDIWTHRSPPLPSP